jgi:hypothetical protein
MRRMSVERCYTRFEKKEREKGKETEESYKSLSNVISDPPPSQHVRVVRLVKVPR